MNKVALANIKKLSQAGWQRTDLAKTLRASLFHDVVSNSTAFSEIHLDGQFL
jgi:hypothetical protein